MPDIHISIHMANIIIINIIINISVPKRQNPVPLHFVKLRYRALKFWYISAQFCLQSAKKAVQRGHK